MKPHTIRRANGNNGNITIEYFSPQILKPLSQKWSKPTAADIIAYLQSYLIPNHVHLVSSVLCVATEEKCSHKNTPIDS